MRQSPARHLRQPHRGRPRPFRGEHIWPRCTQRLASISTALARLQEFREEVSGLLRQHGANLGDELQQKLTGALS